MESLARAERLRGLQARHAERAATAVRTMSPCWPRSGTSPSGAPRGLAVVATASRVAYVGSGNGRVYGISARSGAKVWAGTAGTAIAGPVEDGIQTGLAIGGGLLVVPAGNVVTAFGD
jgi:outer membrane protein assembly factor BamB